MRVFRFIGINGGLFELRINGINNALPEITKRLEYQIRRMDGKKYVRSVPGSNQGMVRSGTNDNADGRESRRLLRPKHPLYIHRQAQIENRDGL